MRLFSSDYYYAISFPVYYMDALEVSVDRFVIILLPGSSNKIITLLAICHRSVFQKQCNWANLTGELHLVYSLDNAGNLK